jgi:hypothetical protein
VLVLLMEGINEICLLDGVRWHDILTTFHDDLFRHSSNIKNLRGCSVRVTDLRDLGSKSFRWHRVV